MEVVLLPHLHNKHVAKAFTQEMGVLGSKFSSPGGVGGGQGGKVTSCTARRLP